MRCYYRPGCHLPTAAYLRACLKKHEAGVGTHLSASAPSVRLLDATTVSTTLFHQHDCCFSLLFVMCPLQLFSAAGLKKHEACVGSHPLCRFCAARTTLTQPLLQRAL